MRAQMIKYQIAVSGLILAACFCSLPATAQEIRTVKDVFAPGEDIVVEFAGAPGNNRDFVTIAHFGTDDRDRLERKITDGRESGRLTIDADGLQIGPYEARLFSQKPRELIARYRFVIGEDWTQAVTLTSPKTDYLTGEPITASFAGVATDDKHWIALIPADRDDGDRRRPDWEYLEGRSAGEITFAGQENVGAYEIRLHLNGTRAEPIARLPITVSHPEVVLGETAAAAPGEEAAAGTDSVATADTSGERTQVEAPAFVNQLPSPGLEGHWLGYVSCGKRRTYRGLIEESYPAFLKVEEQTAAPGALYVMTNRSGGLALAVEAAIDRASRMVAINPQEWIYAPRGNAAPVSLQLTLAENGLYLSGTVKGIEGCPAFEAFKFAPDDRSQAPTGLVALYEQYEQAAVTPENCLTYFKWRANMTFVTVKDVEVPSAVVDGNEFYAMTGVPYDHWRKNHAQLLTGFERDCTALLRQDRTNIETQDVMNAAYATSLFSRFVNAAAPAADARSPKAAPHFMYLGHYAAVTGLRIARLYGDLRVAESQALSASRDSLNTVLSHMKAIEDGSGPFVALPEAEQLRFGAALMTERERISGALMARAFAEFDIDAYDSTLDGLKMARTEELAIKREVGTYATPGQIAALNKDFALTFAEISAAVTDQAMAAMPSIAGRTDSLIEGRAYAALARAEVLSWLSPEDQGRLERALAERNADDARQLAAVFPAWLDTNISGDSEGKAALRTLTQEMLGEELEALGTTALSDPYQALAHAIIRRDEKLRFEICNLPAGFDSLAQLFCQDEFISAMFDGN